jgi:hypothetical protein
MKAPLARLNARYADGKKQLEKAKEAVRLVSKQRLAELMKLPERQRFEQLDDPDLTKPDRTKLQQSIAATLQHRKLDFFISSGGLRWRGMGRWVRYRGPTAIAVLVVLAPLFSLTAIAWRNTPEMVIVPNPLTLDWKLPSGSMERTTLRVGDRLALFRQSGTSALARRWIDKTGYATSPVDLDPK